MIKKGTVEPDSLKHNRKSKFKDYYESYCMNFMNYKMM